MDGCLNGCCLFIRKKKTNVQYKMIAYAPRYDESHVSNTTKYNMIFLTIFDAIVCTD